jgi:hypothetical protein
MFQIPVGLTIDAKAILYLSRTRGRRRPATKACWVLACELLDGNIPEAVPKG